MTKEMKKGKLYMGLNSLEEVPNDPSVLNALFIIHDFEQSWNGQVITEEVVRENMDFLVSKPIVCKYITRDENNGLDALTGHEEFIDIDRNTGEEFISTKTNAIGVFTETYIDDFVDDKGNTKKVLYGKAVLWFDKCRNVCLLLDEWLSNDILIPTSVEYMYYNYNMVDGVEYIQSPLIYLAHALLNAEDRNEYEKVNPAYDSSRLVSLNMVSDWNKAVLEIQNDKGEESDSMDIFKKVCEISKGDLKWLIYDQLSKVMTANEFNSMYISDYDVYDDYFIYEAWNNDEYEYHKVGYTKDDEKDEVKVDFENATEVKRTVKWVDMANQLDAKIDEVEEKIEEIEKLELSHSEKDEAISELKKDNKDITKKFNDATKKLTSLNERLDDLKEIEKTYNAEKFEESLNERVLEFEAKFKSLNALKQFKTDEVQEMIRESIEDESVLVSLNSMLVELIPEVKEKKDEKNAIKDFNTKKIENLTPKDNSFESRYLIK